MTRSRSESRNKLVESSMRLFWKRGFHATSMQDLVNATRVGRGSIYSDFGGKQELYHACMEFYRAQFAEPAIALLNGEADGLEAIRAYFSYFIALHERHGLPGPGCFIANAMTEVAPHDPPTYEFVERHGTDLRDAFSNALARADREVPGRLDEERREMLAQFLVTASQGLWSYARNIDKMSVLENYVDVLMELLRARLAVGAE